MHHPARIDSLLAASLVLCAVAGRPHPARADDKPKPAVLLIDWKGAVDKAERIDLLATFSGALGVQGYALVDDRLRDDTLAGDKRLAHCIATTPCRFELAERLNVELAVAATVSHEPTREVTKNKKSPWKVTLMLLPLDVHRAGADAERKCGTCTVTELEPMITSLVGEALASERKRPRATLLVHSKPSGAAVQLDGDDLGVTDFRHVIYSGEHALDVALGDKKAHASLEVGDGGTTEFDCDLAAGKCEKSVPPVVTPPPLVVPNRLAILRPIGFAAIAAGVVAIGAGVALMAIDHRGTCTLLPPAEECPQRYATLGSGIGIAAGGAAVAIAGGIMTWLGGRRGESKVTLAPLLQPSTLGVAAAGRF